MSETSTFIPMRRYVNIRTDLSTPAASPGMIGLRPGRPGFCGWRGFGRLDDGGVQGLLVVVVEQHGYDRGLLFTFGQAAAQRHETRAAFFL